MAKSSPDVNRVRVSTEAAYRRRISQAAAAIRKARTPTMIITTPKRARRS